MGFDLTFLVSQRNSAENSSENHFPREKMYEKLAPGNVLYCGLFLPCVGQLGVNGYSFAVNNNGYILFHPDLRPTVVLFMI
jgi:hypothetical protein